MFAALGAIFGSVRIYLYLALAAVVVAVGVYIMALKLEKANAIAALATTQATVSVQQAALASDATAIAQLQKARQDSEAALNRAHQDISLSQDRLRQAEEQVNAIPAPKTCNALDTRDRAAVDGVRSILTPGPHPANPGNKGKPSSGTP